MEREGSRKGSMFSVPAEDGEAEARFERGHVRFLSHFLCNCATVQRLLRATPIQSTAIESRVQTGI